MKDKDKQKYKKKSEQPKEAQEVITLIKTAFKGIQRGNGITMRQARAIDDYKDSPELQQARKQDIKNDPLNWEKIPSEDIVKYHDTLTFMDVEGLKYCLPAFMVYAVGDPGSDVAHWTLCSVTGNFPAKVEEYLNAEQLEAVYEWKKFIESVTN